MLKTAALPKKSNFNKLEIGDGKGDNSVGGNSVEFAKKSEKLKDQKLAKS